MKIIKKFLRLGGEGSEEDYKGAVGPRPLLPNPPPKILVVAGEASGDHHAARLVAAIRKRLPGAQFFGVGGEALAAQGVRILCPAHELAVVGLSEVTERLPAVARALRAIGKVIREEKPRLAILVDFPDFNFWVARLAKYRGVKVMYYISPQVWAWRTYRVRTIARLVDRMVVIFPFEEEFYRSKGVPAVFVGHPFRETLPPSVPREVLLKKWGLSPERFTVALLPGSRGSEISRHLPIMLAAAELITRALPGTQFILPLASTTPAEMVHGLTTSFTGILCIIGGQSFQTLTAAHVAVAASGTATLEAALAGTPTVIIYRVSPLTFQVGRLMVRVNHIGMANLLAGEGMFPELIQEDCNPERIAQEVINLIKDPERLEALRRGLTRIINDLGEPGASARAAQVALELIKG